MSRRVINEEVKEANIFNEYASIKPEFDYYKKKETELKDKIKQYCIENNEFEHQATTNNKQYTISVSITDKNDLDIDKLLDILLKMYGKELLLEWGVVENKITLNEEKLQEKIYCKVIDSVILQECIVPKEPICKLRLKEVKKINDYRI